MRSAILPLMAGICLAGISALAEPVLSLASGIDATQFRITSYASGLSFPYGMQPIAGGNLLVGTTFPTGGGDYLFGTGGLRLMTDANHDGIADNGGTVVYNSLPHPVQSVRSVGSDLVAVSMAAVGGSSQIALLRPSANLTDPWTLAGTLELTGPSSMSFNTTLETRAAPGGGGAYDLYFSVNSNLDHANSPNTASVSGLVSGTLALNSIYTVRIEPGTGNTIPQVSGLRQVASGLRNAAGIVYRSANGALYTNDNGWNSGSVHSADELNFLNSAELAGDFGPVDFGFANNYVEYGTGTVVGGAGKAPLAAFQPYPDPNAGAESLGVSEMALSPSSFGSEFGNGLFVAFYGKWEQTGPANNTGPLLYYDFTSQAYQPFIPSGQSGIGHLASLAVTGDTLFVADMNSTGRIRSGTQNGVIYAITYIGDVPEPAAFPLAAAALTGLLLLRRRYKACGPRS